VDYDIEPKTVAAGFVGSLLVLGGLVWFVGVGDVLAALASADPRWVAAMLGAATCWFVTWALSLRTVLGILGSPIRVRSGLLVYAAAVFANNVTPFGQAGGEPFSAYLLSRATGRAYETDLAAVASTDALHFVPSLTLGLVGVGYYAATVAVGRRLTMALAAVVGLAVALPVLAYLAWTRRETLERLAGRVVAPVADAIGRTVPQIDPPGAEAVETRIEGFVVAIERVAGDRRSLATAVGFSALGWLALAVSLWCALTALGYPVPVAAVLVAVPVGDLGAAVPLPGGLGGVEVVQVALLVAATPATPAVAGAAVLLHRGATYWLPMIVGGGAAGFVVSHPVAQSG
jgi:hypothetical protein